MILESNYHECKLRCLGTVNGSLPSFLHAYFYTIGCPTELEPYRIRKVIKFTDLKKYVIANITNDFAAWYDNNKFSLSLCEVIANMVNANEGRTHLYSRPGASLDRLNKVEQGIKETAAMLQSIADNYQHR